VGRTDSEPCRGLPGARERQWTAVARIIESVVRRIAGSVPAPQLWAGRPDAFAAWVARTSIKVGLRQS
jgi:hypothetical protein